MEDGKEGGIQNYIQLDRFIPFLLENSKQHQRAYHLIVEADPQHAELEAYKMLELRISNNDRELYFKFIQQFRTDQCKNNFIHQERLISVSIDDRIQFWIFLDPSSAMEAFEVYLDYKLGCSTVNNWSGLERQEDSSSGDDSEETTDHVTHRPIRGSLSLSKVPRIRRMRW